MTGLLRKYGLMLKWQALSSKTILPISLVVELIVAFGFVIGLGFLYPSISPGYRQIFNHRRADNQSADGRAGAGTANGRYVKNRRYI